MSTAKQIATLQATWETTGSPEDLASLLRARLHAEQLQEEDLLVAALAGEEGARLALGEDAPEVPAELDRRLEALCDLGKEVGDRVVAALASCVADLDAKGRSKPRVAEANGHVHELSVSQKHLLTERHGADGHWHKPMPERGRTTYLIRHAHALPTEVMTRWVLRRAKKLKPGRSATDFLTSVRNMALMARGALHGAAWDGDLATEPVATLRDRFRTALAGEVLGLELPSDALPAAPARAEDASLATAMEFSWRRGDTTRLRNWRLRRIGELTEARIRVQEGDTPLAGPLREILRRWYARPLAPEDGLTVEEVLAAEERVEDVLPQTLVDWSLLIGARVSPDCQDPFVRPANYQADEWYDGGWERIDIHQENQGNYHFYLQREDLGEPDPLVYLHGWIDLEGVEEAEPTCLSRFLVGMTLAQTAMAAGFLEDPGPPEEIAGPLGRLRAGVSGASLHDPDQVPALPLLPESHGIAPEWIELRGDESCLLVRYLGSWMLAELPEE